MKIMPRTASARPKAARPSKPKSTSVPVPAPVSMPEPIDPGADLIANQRAELRNQKRTIQNQKVEIGRLKFLLKTQKLHFSGRGGVIEALESMVTDLKSENEELKRKLSEYE